MNYLSKNRPNSVRRGVHQVVLVENPTSHASISHLSAHMTVGLLWAFLSDCSQAFPAICCPPLYNGLLQTSSFLRIDPSSSSYFSFMSMPPRRTTGSALRTCRSYLVQYISRIFYSDSICFLLFHSHIYAASFWHLKRLHHVPHRSLNTQ